MEQPLALALCAVSLQVALATYFRLGIKNLEGGKPLKGSKVCYH